LRKKVTGKQKQRNSSGNQSAKLSVCKKRQKERLRVHKRPIAGIKKETLLWAGLKKGNVDESSYRVGRRGGTVP